MENVNNEIVQACRTENFFRAVFSVSLYVTKSPSVMLLPNLNSKMKNMVEKIIETDLELISNKNGISVKFHGSILAGTSEKLKKNYLGGAGTRELTLWKITMSIPSGHFLSINTYYGGFEKAFSSIETALGGLKSIDTPVSMEKHHWITRWKEQQSFTMVSYFLRSWIEPPWI